MAPVDTDPPVMHFRNWPQTLRSWVLLLWALYLLYIVLGGNYIYYIMPYYGFLPLAGAVVLVAIYWARRKLHKIRHVLRPDEIDGMEVPGYEYRLQAKMLAPLAIYMLPLFLATAVYPTALAALAIEVRGLNLQPIDATPELQQAVAAFKPIEEKAVKADVESLRINAAQNIGRRVQLDGMQFVPKDRKKYPALKERQIFLTHFIMVCCAADARTATIVLQLPDGGGSPGSTQAASTQPTRQQTFEPVHGKWLHATGCVTLVPWGEGKFMPALVVDKPGDVNHIGKPSKPFIY